jgi:hypothetical protein
LTPYPEIIDTIMETLQGVRTSGCVVNVLIARALMIAIIKDAHPEVLDKFKCSEKFVRAFVESKLDWTMQKATRTTKHIPENAGELCEHTTPSSVLRMQSSMRIFLQRFAPVLSLN